MKNKITLLFLSFSFLVGCASVSTQEKKELSCIKHCEKENLRFYDVVAGQCVCSQPRLPLVPEIP